MSKRLVAYVRVSRVGDRDELRSPDMQERAIRAYCEAHGFEVVEVVVDLDSSGAKVGRKKLRAILDRIVSREIDGIAVYNLDRLSRLAPKDRGAMLDEIEQDGVRGVIASSTEGHDWSTPEGRFVREIFLSVARLEWERKAGNFEVSKEDAIARGVHITGTVPFGYRRPGKAQPLVAHPIEGPLVTRAFEMRAQGASQGDIARFLHDAYPAESFLLTRVKSMLRNRVYLGEARQGKFVRPDSHPALVDPETFDIVQSLFRRYDPRHTTSAKNLLAGVLRCESCGYTMERSIHKQKNAAGETVEYPIYRCKGRNGAGRCPATVTLGAEKVESFVWNATVEELRRDLAENAVEVDAATDRIADVHARLAAAREKLAPFQNADYVAIIGAEVAMREASKVSEEIRVLEAELAEVARENHVDRPDPREILDSLDDLSVETKRKVIAGTFESVIARRVPRGTPVEDRVVLHLMGAGTAPPRPARGRPPKRNHPEEESGELAA